jgi:hypothetical protein
MVQSPTFVCAWAGGAKQRANSAITKTIRFMTVSLQRRFPPEA